VKDMWQFPIVLNVAASVAVDAVSIMYSSSSKVRRTNLVGGCPFAYCNPQNHGQHRPCNPPRVPCQHVLAAVDGRAPWRQD
jgi:hypothetical protein